MGTSVKRVPTRQILSRKKRRLLGATRVRSIRIRKKRPFICFNRPTRITHSHRILKLVLDEFCSDNFIRITRLKCVKVSCVVRFRSSDVVEELELVVLCRCFSQKAYGSKLEESGKGKGDLVGSVRFRGWEEGRWVWRFGLWNQHPRLRQGTGSSMETARRHPDYCKSSPGWTCLAQTNRLAAQVTWTYIHLHHPIKQLCTSHAGSHLGRASKEFCTGTDYPTNSHMASYVAWRHS